MILRYFRNSTVLYLLVVHWLIPFSSLSILKNYPKNKNQSSKNKHPRLRSAQFSYFTSSIAKHVHYPLTAVDHIPNDEPPQLVQHKLAMTSKPQLHSKHILSPLTDLRPEGEDLFSVFHTILQGLIIYIMRWKYIYLSN
jgi:hypothetical protein